MVKYICPTCSKEFKQKQHYIEHTQLRKKPCQTITQNYSKILPNTQNYSQNTQKNLQNSIENTIESTDTSQNNPNDEIQSISVYDCKYCKKIFNRKYNLDRHLNICKVKRSEDEDEIIYLSKDAKTKDEENIELKNKIEKQNKEIEELKKLFYELAQNNKNTRKYNKKITNNNNTTNNNTINNTQNNNANINIILPYGKELENIKLNEVLDHLAVRDFDNLLPKLVKYIYLNKDKPENQNFVVNDIARNKCQYFDGEKWITAKANDKILKLFENTNSLITDPFDRPELEKTLKFIRENKKYESKINTIIESKNFAKSLFDETEKENLDKRQEILDELKLIFYSHRDEILKISL